MIIKKSVLLKRMFLLIYIMACTYLIGVKDSTIWKDYYVYYKYFNDASINDIPTIITSIQDPLFVLFMHPFSFLNTGFETFLIVCGFVTLFLKIYSISNATKNISIFLILYTSYLLCLHDYIQIRIALALAVLCYSIYSLNNGKVKFIFFVIAIFIHFSVIVPIALYYAVTTKWLGYKKLFLFSPFVIIVPMLLTSGVINIPRVNAYLTLQSEGIGVDINMFSILPFIQLLTVIYIFINKKLRENVYSLEYVISYIGIIIFYSTLSIPALALRYFEISNLFYIIMLSKLIKKSYFFILFFIVYILIGIKNYGMLLGFSVPLIS